MLSRVADSLYWMARYLERADNVARLLAENHRMVLDFQAVGPRGIFDQWDPLIQTSGDASAFYQKHTKANQRTVTDFMLWCKDNPNSIISCIRASRENARMIRDQISLEIWEGLNEIYHFLESKSARRQAKSDPFTFFSQIKKGVYLFQGLVHATQPHDEAHDFIHLGLFLERADQTSRILDVKYHILLPSVSEVGGAVDVVQWASVLRSCSAYQVFQKLSAQQISPGTVVEFLVLCDRFPRSIRFSLKCVRGFLAKLSGSSEGGEQSPAELICAEVLADLEKVSVCQIIQFGLHEYLDELQKRLIEVSRTIFKTYIDDPGPCRNVS